jgi:hypothetical protein
MMDLAATFSSLEGVHHYNCFVLFQMVKQR